MTALIVGIHLPEKESLPAVIFPSIPRQELAPMLHELCPGGSVWALPTEGCTG